MSRRKTDGEKVANATKGLGLVGKHYLANRIDRLIRRRMAEAWGDGWFAAKWDKKHVDENPYRGRTKK